MQLNQAPYSQFGLVTDMMSVPGIIRGFQPSVVEPCVARIRERGKLLLTGEGSSRLFPAHQAVSYCRKTGAPLVIHTESGRQSQDYRLHDWAVLGMSNSGRTAEVIRLFAQLRDAGQSPRFSVTAMADSLLQQHSDWGFVLGCGKEAAVAATKSVIEQALFCRALVEAVTGGSTLATRLPQLADGVQQSLTSPIDPVIIDRVLQAKTLYFAGRNDGVAAELTLKTNEITRKAGDFLEGTYAVHGVEEVMQTSDVLIWIDPYPESYSKFEDVLVKGVGMTVIAIATQPTPFPTIVIPDAGDLSGFLQLTAGWNLLVEVGLRLGINLDKPQRARKVGNEFTG
jgi:glutamine---fructose-6-phosphate transaminase (isomerizing)